MNEVISQLKNNAISSFHYQKLIQLFVLDMLAKKNTTEQQKAGPQKPGPAWRVAHKENEKKRKAEKTSQPKMTKKLTVGNTELV